MGRDEVESERGVGGALDGDGVGECEDMEEGGRLEDDIARPAWGEEEMGAWGGEAEVEGVDACGCMKVDVAMASVRLRVERVFFRLCTRSRTALAFRKRGEEETAEKRTSLVCVTDVVHAVPYLLHSLLTALELCSPETGGIYDGGEGLLRRCDVRVPVCRSMLGL